MRTRLATLIPQLNDPSEQVRYRAFAEVRRAGDAAVVLLAEVLAEPSRVAEHANIRAALVKLGSASIGPLVALLEADDPQLVADVIRVLGDIPSREAVFFLLKPYASGSSSPEVRARPPKTALMKLAGRTPEQEAAVQLLVQQAKRYYQRLIPLHYGDEGKVDVWSWNAEGKKCEPGQYDPDDASLLFAARLAREAHDILTRRRSDPSALIWRRWWNGPHYTKGLDQPLEPGVDPAVDRLEEYDVEVIEDLLVYGLDNEHPVVAARLRPRSLGRRGDAKSLLNQGAGPSPLVQAVRNPDRRVRFAAVGAILDLEAERAVRRIELRARGADVLRLLARFASRDRGLL